MRKILLLSILATAGLAVTAIALQAQPYGPGMMGGWGWGSGGGYGPFGMIIWLVILVAVIAGVVWLMRGLMPGGERGAAAPRSAALGVLEERYARGEINREEYLQKKNDLLG